MERYIPSSVTFMVPVSDLMSTIPPTPIVTVIVSPFATVPFMMTVPALEILVSLMVPLTVRTPPSRTSSPSKAAEDLLATVRTPLSSIDPFPVAVMSFFRSMASSPLQDLDCRVPLMSITDSSL